jgi:REP element-mobilizing transposase RayT
MVRPLRINIEDGVYHVTSRGLERRHIAIDDTDRRRWVRLLGQVAQRRKWRVLAWALMTNHFHLFVRTPLADLSNGMHDLNSGYVTLFNRRHERSGPLLQGRFHAVLVERGFHYWELSRYIHLNPVRAGIADRPDTYPWSSCPLYFRNQGAPDWLACEEVLSQHGKTVRTARVEYARFLLEGVSSRAASPLADSVAGTVLGSPSFVDQIIERLKDRLPDHNVPAARVLKKEVTLADVETVVCGAFGVTFDAIRGRRTRGSIARKVAIYLARSKTQTSVTAIGERFGGVGASAISNVVARLAEERRRDRNLDAKLKKLETSLTLSEM